MAIRLRNIRITERLIINFILIGVSSILIVSGYFYYQTKNAILSRTFDQLTAVRVLKKRQLESFFNDRIRDIELLSKSKEILSIQESLSKQNKNIHLADNYLSQYIFTCGYYNGIIISDGTSCFYQHKTDDSDFLIQTSIRNPDFSFLDSLSKLSHSNSKALIVDYLRTNMNQDDYCLYVLTPTLIHKDHKGFIALQIPLKAINTIMLENTSESGFGKTGESYLVGSDQFLRSSSRFSKNSVLNIKASNTITEIANRQKEGISLSYDYRNIEVLSSFCGINVPGLSWILLSEIDKKETETPIIETRNRLLFIGLFISAFVFLFAWILARKITSPIIKLKNASKKIGQGEFTTIDSDGQGDEISELTESFNTMSQQLKEKQLLLEKEKEMRLTAMIDGQELERQRLSRELHDGLGQTIVGLKFRLETMESSAKEDLKKSLGELKNITTAAMDEVRQMSNDLMPAVLSEFGLLKALKNLCNTLRDHTNTEIIFESEGSFAHLNQRETFYLYRIAQEAISNALKYAKATQISIQMIDFKDYLMMIIEDNGIGFDTSDIQNKSGNGLFHMKERTTLLKGNFDLQSKLNEGTLIRIRIPKAIKNEE